jgi:hypothetical protein
MEGLTLFIFVTSFFVIAFILFSIYGRLVKMEQEEDDSCKPKCPPKPKCGPRCPPTLDGFQDKEGRNCRTVVDTTPESSKPYMTTQHLQGDYYEDNGDGTAPVWMDKATPSGQVAFEKDIIFNSEGGREATRAALSAAKNQFQFDWAQLPPSSSLYQQNQASYVAAPYNAETFVDIIDSSASDPVPIPYKPSDPNNYKKTEPEDVKKWLNEMYKEKGLIPEIVEKPDNVYEVIGTREINPKIVYEDEVARPTSSQQLTPSDYDPRVTPNSFVVPPAAQEISAGLDPFNSALMRTSVGRQTVMQWSPELEGMFGKKMQWQQWG